MNVKKYIVKQFTQKSHPYLFLGLQQKSIQQNAFSKPLTYIQVRADIKLLKQMVQIIHNNPQIWIDQSVDLSTSKVVLKQQLYFFNEDIGSFTKINKFQQDVDFKKMQGQSNYKISVQKTKFIRKNTLNTDKAAQEKRVYLTEIAKLRKQNNELLISKEKYIKQLQIANVLSKKINDTKIIASYESKQKDLKKQINSLKQKLVLQNKKYSELSALLDQNILKKDYDHMKSTLQNQLQAKQNLFTQNIILKRKLQQQRKR